MQRSCISGDHAEPVLNICPGLRNAEPRAPGFETIPAAQLSERLLGCGADTVVELGNVGKDETAGDERVNNCTARRWYPAVQALQEREIIAADVMAGQIIGAP